MKQFKKVVANVGKYTDANGNEKNRYLTVGKAFVRDDNSVCVKIDSMPIGNEFTGWLNFYDLDDDKARPAAPAPVANDKEDLPF